MAESAETTVREPNRGVEAKRLALQRLLFIGGLAWASFVVVDIAGAWQWHDAAAIPGLLALRLLGTAFLAAVYSVVRWVPLRARSLDAVDVTTCLIVGTLASIMGIEYGGAASRDFAGIMLMVCFRATLVPASWKRTAVSVGAFALTWPAVNAAAALLVPSVRAQWSSAHVPGDFVLGVMFILLAAVMCTAASHSMWSDRLKATEVRRLGNYRLQMRLASGGNGDVWLARQEPLGRDVVLKVLKDHGLPSIEKVRRFEREARAAASLKHPNTIRIFEFGVSAEGILFIAMELLEGLDLDRLVEITGPLPPARAVRFVLQACASLVEAHDAGIVHRDIKPANLYVTRVGEEHDFLKLLDFGVARLPEGAATLTAEGTLFGTPAYMSPEVCEGDRATPRSDIYSLGAVLYFMLTGTPLFPDKTFSQTILSQISRTPELPSQRLGAAIPPALEAVVMRCLEKKPERRFQSVRDLEVAIKAVEGFKHWGPDEARAWWSTRGIPVFRARGTA
jgi:tRNA A-37 threonylcarbamoyl transferase component Bud32